MECLQGKKVNPPARVTLARRYGNPPTRVTLAARSHQEDTKFVCALHRDSVPFYPKTSNISQ